MALRKSQLYSSLWQSCDELRGGMDASQYKDYILTLLFMKYVSDKYAGKRNALLEVPEGGGFADMVKLRGNKDIGEGINKIIARMAEANDLQGVIDQANFNDPDKLGSGKDMQDKLSKLVGIFQGLDLRANRAEGDDLLGDAYEYLMRNFATESGKSKGQFYTPAEVSRIMAKVVGLGPDAKRSQTIYDPTCGSGSLLIKAADETPHGLSIYGQEMDNATWALARMNMILHGHDSAELWRGNTLAAPHFRAADGGLKTFDFAVANPPFSTKAWTSGLDPKNDEFGRFALGEPPAKNGDYAFLLHLVASLKSTGTGAIILPHGVLFRGNREGGIRRALIKRGLIKGIIGLPANLFYGTGIPACIVVVDKAGAATRTGVFMVDASREFAKDGAKNRLRSQDVHRIVDVFTRGIEEPGYSRMVPAEEIAGSANDYNLNLSRYIDSAEPEDRHDLDAHLNGGIPDRDVDALSEYWEVFPGLRGTLFEPGNRPGYSEPCLPAEEVRETITGHPEFVAYGAGVRAIFDGWWTANEPMLRALKVDDLPREVIATLSEDLLRRFRGVPLVSGYDVYQRLMDYWASVMQDDVYAIAADGWVKAAQPRPTIEDKDRKIKEAPDLVVGGKKWKMDVLPPALVAARYFSEDRASLDALRARQDAAAQELAELVEEHTGEYGILVEDPTERVTRAGVNARLRTARKDELLAGEDEESKAAIAVLEQCLGLIDAEAAAAKATRAAEATMDARVLAQYDALTENDIKSLVIEDKWCSVFGTAVAFQRDQAMQHLLRRTRHLTDRYSSPLVSLSHKLEGLSSRVDEHLARMGVAS